MRIISGKYKGKQLNELKFDHVRPTADKVKQALFTKFQFDIPESRVLDLFCGTGALGIEALSRGAKEVVFVDKSPKSVNLTKKNLKMIGEEAKVYCVSFDIALQRVEGKFDFIFIDPPYKSGLYEKALSLIADRKLLNEKGVIICEHLKIDKFDYSPFEVVDEKTYGTVMLTFLSYN